MKPGPSRRQCLQQVLMAGLGAGPNLRAWAQPGPSLTFPARPMRLIVPWPAGGATDVCFRILAEVVGRHLGQRVVVENRPGAGGTLAMPILQQAVPDGYTLAQLPYPVLRIPHIQPVTWDPVRDTTPIIQLSGVTFGVVVPASSPWRSLQDLLQFAAARPGELTISTNGLGTTPHVVLEALLTQRGLRYVHVPYKGTSEQMLAVASGQLMAGVNSNGFAPYVDTGKLRLLVTFGEQRARRWPQTPTLKELGFGIVAASPYGLVGPAGMDPAVVQTLHEAFRLALFDPAHLQELNKYDQEPTYLNPRDYGHYLRQAYEAEKKSAEQLRRQTSG